jgi:hypothetical protein
MTDAIQAFIKDVGQARSKNTARTYYGLIRRLPAFCKRDAVTEMGEPLLRAYFAQLRAANLSQNTLAGAGSASGIWYPRDHSSITLTFVMVSVEVRSGVVVIVVVPDIAWLIRGCRSAGR